MVIAIPAKHLHILSAKDVSMSGLNVYDHVSIVIDGTILPWHKHRAQMILTTRLSLSMLEEWRQCYEHCSGLSLADTHAKPTA